MKKNLIKGLMGVTFVLGMMASFNANAWFFFFIPGAATRAIGDAITGAKGDICVKDTAKVGDILTSNSGNTAKVISTSGTSSMCTNPAIPIRAELEFTYSFSSKAGVNLQDDYEATPITDLQRYNGILLIAKSKTLKNKGVSISAITRKPTTDYLTIANNLEKNQIAKMKNASSSNPEKLKIQGLNAVRFEVNGTLNGLFGSDETYQITVIEAMDELLVVNAYVPTADYPASKDEMQKIALDVTGLNGSTSYGITKTSTPSTTPLLSEGAFGVAVEK